MTAGHGGLRDGYDQSADGTANEKRNAMEDVTGSVTDNGTRLPDSLDGYTEMVRERGIGGAWGAILSACEENPASLPAFLAPGSFGELYEIGLAEADKVSKKELGKYYTPSDVAGLMSGWLTPMEAECVADVACGTGNLILSYLGTVGDAEARRLVEEGRIWLYDLDPLAMDICVHLIAMRYGNEALASVHTVVCDFLDEATTLPDGCKVISNPPYHKVTEFPESWDATPAARQCRDLYGAFLEKIVRQSVASVVITPYSFIGSGKFSLLRAELDERDGFVVSYDNIPGNIFSGRKHGVFNTNHANSVRAAITVTGGDDGRGGRRVSPLIRFSSDERGRALDADVLEGLLPDEPTCLGPLGWPKCMRGLVDVLSAWQDASDTTFGDLVTKGAGGARAICVPTTCRYYLSGTARDLARAGKRVWGVTDGGDFDYVYAMLNSSFAYWHWRLYDGGVNYSAGLLQAMPTFAQAFRDDGELARRLHCAVADMVAMEGDCLVYKTNAGKAQENVKFPVGCRDRLNRILLDAIGCDGVSVRAFDAVHSPRLSTCLGTGADWD